MPLLKKSYKGNQSQTSNSKFKVPYLQQKHNIRDLIDDNHNKVHDIKKPYNAFPENCSQKEFTNASSSPKTLVFSHGKLQTSSQSTQMQKKTREKANGTRFEKKGRKRELSYTSEDSLSQEVLNKPEIKAAYLEFMKKNLTKENGIQKKFVSDTSNSLQNLTQEYSQTEMSKGKNRRIHKKHSKNKQKSSENNSTDDELFELSQEILANHSFTKNKKEKQAQGKSRYKICPSESTDSFSQKILNNGEVKAAYVEFMNKSLAKEKETKKNRNYVIYSSSEDLFKELETLSQSPPLKKRKKDLTLKIYSPKRFNNDKSKSSKNNSQANNKYKKKSQVHVKNHEEENSDGEFSGLTLEEKMDEIYKKRNVGLYALCDTCDKARFLPHTVDPLDLPDKWYCHMNPDKKHNKCSDPEEIEENKEFLIDNLYNAGSIVFVKMDGFPWWPAMVEDDPDTESYFWLEGESMQPTFYHTTFFDSSDVTRAWTRTHMIKPFKKNLMKRYFQIPEKSKYRSRLTAAYKQAEDASSMPLLDRLMKYGFVKRYKKRGNGKKLKKITHSKKTKVMQPCEEDELGILSDINLSDLSFNFLD